MKWELQCEVNIAENKCGFNVSSVSLEETKQETALTASLDILINMHLYLQTGYMQLMLSSFYSQNGRFFEGIWRGLVRRLHNVSL